MNFVNPYIFAPPIDLSTNTEIGGVAATISTPALLATKLGIDVSRITNFSTVGSDIKCRITGSYSLSSYFSGGVNSETTYYDDNDGLVYQNGYVRYYPNTYRIYTPNLVSFLSGYYGRDCPLLKLAYFPYITSISNSQFYESNCDVFYIPRVTILGPTTGDNSVFNGLFFNDAAAKTIYCHPSLATNNSGAPDGDIAYAISIGATVRYVTNFTAPNPVTTLASGTIYNTAIQLNFTAPTGSTNAIDYYELYINDVLQTKKILTSGEYITGLTPSTSYNFTLIAVDIFYNKSVVSNSLSVSTNTTPYYQQEKMISSYQMENNVNDSIGSNNGIATSITYASGLVGQAAVFNGSSSKIANTVFLGYDSFTIIAIIKTSSTADKIIFSNRNSSTGNTIIALAINSGKLYSRIRSSAGTGITYLESTRTVNNNVNRFVAVTFNKTTGLQSNYIDGTFENSITYSGGSFSGLNVSSIGVGEPALNYGFWSGNIDEVVVFNTDLTASQIADVNTKLQAGNHL